MIKMSLDNDFPVISPVAHKLYLIYMNKQEKFTTQSRKLKVHTEKIHKLYHPILLDFP